MTWPRAVAVYVRGGPKKRQKAARTGSVSGEAGGCESRRQRVELRCRESVVRVGEREKERALDPL